MATTFRVEAHDGTRYSFGVRIDENKRIPVFCGITFADHFRTRAEALEFKAKALRLCGGTLRVAAAED